MTTGAATEKTLGQIHDKVAKVMLNALNTYDTMQAAVEAKLEVVKDNPDMELPALVEPSAALLGAITKFLKDNEVTCQTDNSDSMSDLERRLKQKREAREGTVVPLRSIAVSE